MLQGHIFPSKMGLLASLSISVGKLVMWAGLKIGFTRDGNKHLVFSWFSKLPTSVVCLLKTGPPEFKTEVVTSRLKSGDSWVLNRLNQVCHHQSSALQVWGGENTCTIKQATPSYYFTFLCKDVKFSYFSTFLWLLLQVCNIVAGQRCIKKLTDNQTSTMIKATARSAPDRQEEISRLVSDMTSRYCWQSSVVIVWQWKAPLSPATLSKAIMVNPWPWVCFILIL